MKNNVLKITLILILFLLIIVMVSSSFAINANDYYKVYSNSIDVKNEAVDELDIVSDEEYDESFESYDTVEVANNCFGAVITLIQVGAAGIGFLIIFIIIIKYIRGSEEKRKKIKHNLVIYIVLALVFFAFSGLLSTTKTFKPIIYLYPTEDMNLSVKFDNPEKLAISYPDYGDGWNVLAKTDGTLTDLKTGRNLYALYYENYNKNKYKVEKDGFIVKGEDVAQFLEEKLAILGLNERESEEFIVYWLPILEKNKYNYIRFATNEEIDANTPISFSVEPDTFIRVLMTYKNVLIPFDVEEQKLETPERTGFVAVEWGGTEIK